MDAHQRVPTPTKTTQDFKSHFTIVPNFIIYELKPISLRLLLLVLERTNNKKDCIIYLRNDQVAEILNVTHTSVSNARSELRKKHLISTYCPKIKLLVTT